MPVRRRSASSAALRGHGFGMEIVPESVRAAIRRRSSEIVGVAILGAVTFALVSLMTWSAGDPSLVQCHQCQGQQSARPPGRGGLGPADAIAGAGLARSAAAAGGVGLAAPDPPPAPGRAPAPGGAHLRRFGHQRLPRCAAHLRHLAHAHGLGGVMGDLVPRLVMVLTGNWSSSFAAIVVGAAGFALGAAGLFLACRPTAPDEDSGPEDQPYDLEEEEVERGAMVSLGALTHLPVAEGAPDHPPRPARHQGRGAGPAFGAAGRSQWPRRAAPDPRPRSPRRRWRPPGRGGDGRGG